MVGQCLYMRESVSKATKYCAKEGDYSVQTARTGFIVGLTDAEVHITDSKGCSLGSASVPERSSTWQHGGTGATVSKSEFSVNPTAGDSSNCKAL